MCVHTGIREAHVQSRVVRSAADGRRREGGRDAWGDVVHGDVQFVRVAGVPVGVGGLGGDRGGGGPVGEDALEAARRVVVAVAAPHLGAAGAARGADAADGVVAGVADGVVVGVLRGPALIDDHGTAGESHGGGDVVHRHGDGVAVSVRAVAHRDAHG